MDTHRAPIRLMQRTNSKPLLSQKTLIFFTLTARRIPALSQD